MRGHRPRLQSPFGRFSLIPKPARSDDASGDRRDLGKRTRATGGDEINIVLPGRNYGWPLVTFGMNYDGTKISDFTSRPDLEGPVLYFVPSIAPSGMAFYTGDKFPNWKGNLFVGSMFEGRTRGAGHLRRITFERDIPSNENRSSRNCTNGSAMFGRGRTDYSIC